MPSPCQRWHPSTCSLSSTMLAGSLQAHHPASSPTTARGSRHDAAPPSTALLPRDSVPSPPRSISTRKGKALCQKKKKIALHPDLVRPRGQSISSEGIHFGGQIGYKKSLDNPTKPRLLKYTGDKYIHQTDTLTEQN
jgi:hypothetical protein